MTEQKTATEAALVEVVELKILSMPRPKQIFVFGRLWDFESSEARSGSPVGQHKVGIYHPSQNRQQELDVLAWILCVSPVNGAAWMTPELLVVLDATFWLFFGEPAIRKVQAQ